MTRPRRPLPSRRTARKQRGLSIVELMVGLTVGMLLVAGLAIMFGNASRSSVELDKTARHIENGRHAMDILSEDLAMAGFYGTVPIVAYAAGLPPCSSGSTVAGDLAGKASAGTPSIPFPVEGIYPAQTANLDCLANRKANSPALVMRRVDAVGYLPDAIPARFRDAPFVQASHYPKDNFNSYKASTGQSPATFDLRNLQGNKNPVHRFLTRVYYLASCGNCNNGGDNIPTLKRVEMNGSTRQETPIAEGIDQIAFDYGFDTNNDGIADDWYGLNGDAGAPQATIAAAKGWGNVVAVRIHLVSRNTEPTPGHKDTRQYPLGLNGTATIPGTAANDAFKRRAYVTTIKLQTVAGLREAP